MPSPGASDRPGDRPGPRLILASASPRRAALLRESGYPFSVSPAPHAEPDLCCASLQPAYLVEALSYFKARSAAQCHTDGIILAADTVAANREVVFGKARDAVHARQILTALAGPTHEVITGVTLLSVADSRRRIAHAVTRVTMRRLSAAQMDAYVDSEAWRGKAGAYGIQDANDPFVERIAGSFSNVVGMPMELLAALVETL